MRAVAVLCLLFVAAGCARKETIAPDHGPGHAHTAPHGGVLVELGEHAASLEFKFDGEKGVLQAWVLDGHAENFVRIKQGGFEVEARTAQAVHRLDFFAMGDALTGETPGDTATFVANAEWLGTAKAFDGRVNEITVRGSVYRDIPFKFSVHESHAH